MDHDHGSMMMGDCGMSMSLHWRTCEPILVSSWKTDTTTKFVFACIFFFVLAFFYEALKYYRESMFMKHQQNMRSRTKKVSGEDGTTTTIGLSTREQILNLMHGSQTILHGVQVFISYILMLVVMLCNNTLIIMIVLGAALGYFVFGWMRKVPCQDSNECCY